jgi:O-antigen/teichoic acid export membrane protein
MRGISLGRVTILLLMSRAAGFILALGNSVILARILGVERLGEYAYAMGFAALFGLLPNMGIGTVVTRAIARDSAEGEEVFRTALRAQVLLAGGMMIVIPAVAALLPVQPVSLLLIGLAAAQLAIGTLSWPYLAVLSGHARYDRLAIAELTTGGCATVFLLAAAVLYGGVMAFLVAHVLAAGVAVLVAQHNAAPFLQNARSQAMSLSTLFRQGAPFGAGAAVQSLYTRVDILLLGQLASTVALGLYSVAYKPITMVVYFGGTVAGVLFPLMVQAPKGCAPEAFRRVLHGLGAGAPAIALLLSGLASPLLIGLYGSEYAAAAPILIILAWSAAANWLYAPLGVALQARGGERWWLAILGCGLSINLLGNLWGIPRWGAVGAAAATLVSEIAVLCIAAVLVRRDLSFISSVKPVLIGIASATTGGAVLWLLRGGGPLLATLASLLVYCSLLAFFQLVTTKDVVTVVGWMRQAGWGEGRG